MSDEVIKDEPVDAVAELKSVIDTAVETKADKADLEGLVKADDIAEFVKADAIESAKSEILEAVEAKFDALPAITKAENKSMDVVKFEDIEHNGAIVKGQVFRKSFTDNTDVNGGRVGGQSPYYILEQGNVLGRTLGTVIPSGGQGVVKLPDVDTIAWHSQSASPVSRSGSGTGSSNIGGGINSKNVTIETWESYNQYSIASLQDVPAMDPAITGLMAQTLGTAEQDDAVAVIKAATLASNHAVTTGVATGLPAAADVIGKMADMREALSSGYNNRSWIVSRELMGRLQESNNTTLNFDPRSGIQTLFGDPVYVIDSLESSGTDGNLVGVYGDFKRGLALCSSSEMTIGRYDQTAPGAMVYFGMSRFKNAVWDTSAMVTLKAGA